MKKVRISLNDYLDLNGFLKIQQVIFNKELNLNVFFQSAKNENEVILIGWNTLENDDVKYSKIENFEIDTEVMLIKDVKKIVTDAYNMGGFYNNSMARTLHKDINAQSLNEFLDEKFPAA